nr:unnamed protein product [Digitaria exilis]
MLAGCRCQFELVPGSSGGGALSPQPAPATRRDDKAPGAPSRPVSRHRHRLTRRSSPAPGLQAARAAAPFLAVLLRRGRAAAALLLNRHLRAAPASEARSLLSALPAVRDAVSYNTVISALCCRSGGDLPAALDLLRDMSREPHPGARPNAVSYTAVMRGLCAARRTDEAVGLLRDMQACGVRPDVVTYGTLIQGLCDASEVDRAVELLNEMCASGIEPGVVVYSCLLRGYCKSGRWQDVGKVFEEMSQRRIEPDAIMFTGLIDSLCKKGNTRKAAKVKDMMVERGLKPDAVTYNVLINALCKEGLMREAMTLKKEMLEKGVTPTIVTYNILIRALSGVLEMDEAMGLLEEMIQGDIALEPDVITFSSVIHGLCKIGRMFQAVKVCEMMANRGCTCDLVTYNCLIGGFLRVHKVEMAMKLMDELASSGLEPDSFTYSILINGFTMCQQGMMERATILFNEMDKNCRLDVVAYSTMIHGKLEEAEMVLKQMTASGFVPDAVVFDSLIKARQKNARRGSTSYPSITMSSNTASPSDSGDHRRRDVSSPVPECVVLVSNASIVKSCPCRNATTAAAVTSNSLPIEVSLELAPPPPLPSTLAVYFPGADPSAAHSKILFAVTSNWVAGFRSRQLCNHYME